MSFYLSATSGECGKNNNNNPCEHICLDLHDGTYECSCFYGFTLAVDGYSCAHIAPAAQQTMPSPAAAAITSSSFLEAGNISTTTPPAETSKSSKVEATAATETASAGLQSNLQDRHESLGEDSSLENIGRRPFAATNIEVTANQGDDNVSFPAARTETISSTTTGANLRELEFGLGAGNKADRRKKNSRVALVSASFPPTELIEQSANDNRKLVDELARGAKAAGGTEQQQQHWATPTKAQPAPSGKNKLEAREEDDEVGGEIHSGKQDETLSKRSRQRRLLNAVARIRQEEAARVGAETGGGQVGPEISGANEEAMKKKKKTTSYNNNNPNPPKFSWLTKKTNGISSSPLQTSTSSLVVAIKSDHQEPHEPLETNSVAFWPQTTTSTKIAGSSSTSRANVDGPTNKGK